MILSLPISLLNMLLIQSFYNELAHNVEAFGMPNLQTTRMTTTTFLKSKLYARPNRNIVTNDPYASLINKVAPSSETATATATPDITTSSIPEPTPSIESMSNQLNDLIDQVNQAANTAIEASNQLNQNTDTLNLITTPVVTETITNAATTTTTTTPPSTTLMETITSSSSPPEESYQRVPTLFEYFTSENLKNDLSTMKQNLTPSIESTTNVLDKSATVAKNVVDSTSEGLNVIAVNAKSFVENIGVSVGSSMSVMKESTLAASGSSAGEVGSSSLSGASLQDFIDNLRFDLYGAWYLAGATFLYALSAKEMGKEEAMVRYEAELNEAKMKALEAAKAAGVAAEGAKMAKELMSTIERKSEGNKKDIGDILLENAKLEELMVENVSVFGL